MKKNFKVSGVLRRNLLRKLLLIMRITLFLLTTATFSLFATGTYSQNAKVTVEMKNASIKEVLTAIENVSEFFFIYNNGLIDVDRKVDINVKEQKISDVLGKLFKADEVEISVIDRKIVLAPVFMKMQQQQLKGTVIDATTNEPVIGANVIIEGTTIGTSTDVDGKFSLNISKNDVTIVISFLGYNTERITLAGQTTLEVKLVPDITKLDEIVVIGYGTQKKSDLTGAVAQVKGDELKKLAVNNIQNALQGQTAGVYVSQSSGAPGAGAEVIIRGQTSVTGLNSVLYVVDGIPITGAINNINPQDIESIEVLKDASAAAIYGSRASSGVILVTTKRGKSNEPKVTFDASYGWQSLSKKIPMLNAQQWAELQEESVENNIVRFPSSTGLHVHNPFVWDASTGAVKPNIKDSTDWQDSYFRVAPVKNYNLSFSGGNEKSKVYVSAGFQDQQGIAPNTYFKRYNMRLNSDHKVLSDRVKIGNNLAMSYFTSRGVTQNEDFSGGVGSVLRMSPLIAAYKQPGTYEGESNRFAGTSDTRFYGPAEAGNPLREALLNNNNNGTYNITGSLFADVEIVKGLIFHSDWGGEVQFNEGRNFIYTYREYLGGNNTNRLNRSYGKQYQLQARNYLNYDKVIGGDHKINVMAGTDFQDFYDNDFSTYRLNFTAQDNPDLWYLPLGVDSTASNNESASSWAILSYYGRANYTYKDRYLVTATVRSDGSSRFAKQDRWGTFPSFSFGWKLSNESFFPKNPVLTDVKLRAGWGLLGNERSAGNYVTAATLGRGVFGGIDNGYIFGTGQTYNTGASPLRIPSEDLTWESSEQMNIGLDLGLLDRRITIVADYFIKNTKDMILALPLPVAGRGRLDAPKVNIGTLQNKGFEFEINYFKREGDFRFDLGLNLTTGRGNKVTKLAPGVDYLDGGTYRNNQAGIISRTLVGEPIGLFYLHEVAGIFRTADDLANYPKQSNAAIGDYIYKNHDTTSVNGVQVINNNDRISYGNPWPIFVGGFKFNAYYKGFDLNMFFQGSYGNDILNTTAYFLHYNGSSENFNYSTEALDRFHPTKNPDGKYPMLFSQDPANNRNLNSSMVEDGSYLRLQNLQLGYTLPDKLIKAIRFSSFRVFVSMSNVFTLTNYSGYNPDLGTRNSALQKGVDRGLYPVSRTVTMGVNMSF